LLAVGLWNVACKYIERSVAVAVGIGLLGLAAAAPFWVIQPEYQTPTLAKWQAWTLPHRSDATFGDKIRLLGYRAESTESSEQLVVNMTLYWQAIRHPELDYSAFVHAFDESGELVAQSDVGLGSDRGYPSSAWWAEDIVPSQHTLMLPLDAATKVAEIRVGVYFWADQSRLPVVEGGVPVSDFVTLEEPMRTKGN